MSSKEHRDGKKRSKAYYRKSGKNGKNYSKQDRMLQSGMQGILMTCSGNAAQCVREAYSLLNEYADRIYGPEEMVKADGQNDEDVEEDSDEDIAVSLEKEVQAMKEQRGSKDRRFRNVRTGAKNVIFIQTNGVDPHKIVHTILVDMETTGTTKGRYIQRMLPVSHVCKALEERIEKTAQEMLYSAFHSPDAKDTSFCIMFKARNNGKIRKDAIVRLLAPMVMEGSVHIHRVDFDTPDLTVLVDVIGAFCCLSVLEGYGRFKRYNLHLVAKGDGDMGSGGEKRKREDVSSIKGEEDAEQNPTGRTKKPRQEDSEDVATTTDNTLDCIPTQDVAIKSADAAVSDGGCAAVFDARAALDDRKPNNVAATETSTSKEEGSADGASTTAVFTTETPENSNSVASVVTTTTPTTLGTGGIAATSDVAKEMVESGD